MENEVINNVFLKKGSRKERVGVDIQLTERLLRILRLAEKEMKASNCQSILPIHLLIACLEERTGVLGEIFLKVNIDLDKLRSSANEVSQTAARKEFLEWPVSIHVFDALAEAANIMKRYNQIYLNEGHLLKALIKMELLDEFLSEENEQIILSLGTTSRDMITNLQNYTFPEVPHRNIRRVTQADNGKITRFMEEHFAGGWVDTIKIALLQDNPSIYMALGENEEILGFAGFDIVDNKRNYFGPMGVVHSGRNKGIGFSLLHHCLKEMKEIGYGYAIIGGAGPIEFYEKACNAVAIPSS